MGCACDSVTPWNARGLEYIRAKGHFAMPEGKNENSTPGDSDVSKGEADKESVGESKGTTKGTKGGALEGLKKRYEEKEIAWEGQQDQPTLFQKWKKIRLWLLAVIAVVAFFGIRPYTTRRVPSDADNMTAIFPPTTTILIHKDFVPPDLKGRPLQLSDCILYTYVHEGRSVEIMGRVVGLPNDRIHVVNGEVTRNGEKMLEVYLTKPIPGDARSSKGGEQTVPSGSVFILNDDRGSRVPDSRDFGGLKAEQIIGKIVIGNHWE